MFKRYFHCMVIGTPIHRHYSYIIHVSHTMPRPCFASQNVQTVPLHLYLQIFSYLPPNKTFPFVPTNNSFRIHSSKSAPILISQRYYPFPTKITFYPSSISFSDIPFLFFHAFLPLILYPTTIAAASEGLVNAQS